MQQRTVFICAWILWAHFRMGPGLPLRSTDYVAVQGYGSQAACEKAQRDMRPSEEHDRFACFPDTIDPRFRAVK